MRGNVKYARELSDLSMDHPLQIYTFDTDPSEIVRTPSLWNFFLIAMNLKYFIKPIFIVTLLQIYPASAQTITAHAVNLSEELISVDLSGDRKQVGVYTTSSTAKNPTRLAVLLPGYPSVVRPVVENGVMTNSRLSGNFLIRSRHFLVDETIASLIVDCQSDSGEYCTSTYQASKQRQEDVDKLID